MPETKDLQLITLDGAKYAYDLKEGIYYSQDFGGQFTVIVNDQETVNRLFLNNSAKQFNQNLEENPIVPNSSTNTGEVTLNATEAFGQLSRVTFKSIVKGRPDIAYPFLSNTDDYILFRAMELNTASGIVPNRDGPISPIAGAFGPNSNRRLFTDVRDGGSVRLSIQAPIMDQNSANWGPNGVDMLQAIMYNSAMSGLNSEGHLGNTLATAIESLAEETGGAFQKLFGNGQGAYKSLFAAMAADNPGIFNRTTGLVFNPNLELIFNGPELRPFNFTFLLAASSQEESREIRSIIKFFKYHMAPKVNTGTGLFLRTPNVFSITYMKGNENVEHNSIGRITSNQGQKACALTQFGVDYTPLGSYMTYDDGENSMIAYRLQMQFNEIVPIYDVDYEGLPENSIGY